MKAETSLRELRVWGQETSKVQAGPMDGLPAAVSAAVAGDFSVEAPSLIIPSLPSLNLMAFSQGEDTLAPGIINYHIGEDVSSAWALMHGNPSGADTPLDALKNILIKEPNTFVRADALKHFLAEYQGDSRFLPALKDIVERSAHPDVVWELLKYMSQREDRDPRFLVEVIDEGENSRDHLLVRLGFQALRDVLTMYPQEMKKLSPADFITSAHSPYPRATITAANKVFLTFLAQEPDDSIAAERLVQSDFWSTDDLKDIYKKLETAKDDHPGSAPQIEALAQFIQAADKRKAALDNIDQVFTPGPFGEHGGAVFQRDIISYIQIMDNARESQRFLNTSPQWEKMAAFIHPKLYACTLSEVQRPGPAAAAVPVDPVYDLMPSTAQHPELEYFQSLGLKEQEGYIEQSQDICELNRILDLNTPLRTVVLDRLMASSQGRVLVLKTYLGSDAPDLLGLIESRSWDTVLLADIPNIEDAASNRIVRSGLEKMYDRTGQEKYLNLRLLTYSDFELPALDDPRGKRIREAAIRRAAAIRALQAYQKHMEVEVLPWAGYSIQDARTKTEIANLQRIFVEEPDPVKVDEYIDSHTVLSRQVPRRIFDQINIFDGSVHSMFDYIRGARAKFVKRLAANDQSIPRLNIPQMASFLGLSAFLFLTSLYKRTYRFYRRNILHSDDQIKGLMYALKGDKLDKNLAVKWLKAHQENRLDRKGQIIGQDQGGQAADDFKTLSVNPPVQVYLPSREAFQTWYVLVSDWKTAPKVPPERLMADLNTILNNAKEVLRKMPYEPDLMYSGHAWESLDTDTYQKTYSYFMGLALETLNVMNVRLSGQKIGESQRRWMQAEAGIMNDMVKYVNRYLRVLTYRGNIERAISKKFSYQHWTERSKLAPLVRWILTDSYLWGQSQKRLFKELPLLLDEGNALMPDFYQDKDSIIEDTRIALNTATKRGGSLNNTQAREDRHNFRLGDFWGRVVYLSAFGLGFAGLAGIFIGYNMPFVELSTIAFFVVWVKVYLSYWRPHLDLLRMEWNKLAHKIRGDLKAQLDQKLGDFTEGPRKKQVVFFARKENQEQTAVELDTSHAPNVDMIVVVVSNAKSTANIENYVKGLRGQLIRNDIPVMVIPSRYQGSGNAYLSMLLRARDKFRSPAYKNKNRYPYLKSWDKSRKLFIFIGKEIDGMDVEYPLLDLSLQTGYRLAQKDPDMNGNAVEGGHITIYARDAYYGPTPYFPQQGITFLTARANRDELKERGFVNTNDRHDTLSPVSEILEKLDIAALENDKRSRKGRTLEYLEEKFNLQNHAIKQFDTLSGIVDVAPDAEEYLLKIAAYVDEHQLWKQWNRHLVGDLFVPTLMWMSNLDEEDKEEEIEQYIDKRSRWSDVNPNGHKQGNGHNGHKNGNGYHEIQEKLRPFYTFIKGLNPQIAARAFLPYPLLTVSMHIAGKKFQEEMDRFKSIDHAQISQVPVLAEPGINSRPGGIDLSQTSEKILFKKGDG
ncbi:MAG: hypothetical protein KGJ11_05690, partial [Candidatus Omnitrophica bacterium]|nr:hypothetical protein [Candidatus Omnitrophota bacterium]